MKKNIQPHLIYSDRKGNIFEDESLFAAGRSGFQHEPLFFDDMIELPFGSQLFELPGRAPIGFDRNGAKKTLQGKWAVAAFVAPAHTQLLMASYENAADAPVLPLYAYTAVGWHAGKFYVPAKRIDPDIRQDLDRIDQREIERRAGKLLKRFAGNRLAEHIIGNCALQYFCPAARNFVMERWEAPLPTSPYCNARCIGCISLQDKKRSPVKSTQARIALVPSAGEVAEVAVYHLERAPRPVVSFGQGCEGEPLLVWELLRDSIKAIRKRTKRGIINLNTNACNPSAIAALCGAGLDSVRVSMNSVREKIYTGYYRPKGYAFGDVMESVRVARERKIWISVNYFVMPGMTDQPEEYESLREFIRTMKIHMIQWRNFNIDPDWYLHKLRIRALPSALGMATLLQKLQNEFPWLMYGYFNPARESMETVRKL